MTKVLIVGLTGSGELGSYQTQLGNVAILIPMIKLIKQYIPDAEIATHIQLTDAFCVAHGISIIPKRKQYLPRFNILLHIALSFLDLVRASLWKILKTLHIDARILIKSKRLERFAGADIALDFNGDIFPSDTSPYALALQTLEIMTIKQLGKPVIEFVSSPGPFKTWYRRTVAKLMYGNVDLFLNRETISSGLLKQISIRKPIVNTACPAFLLEPASPERGKEILLNEGVDIKARPLIGLTLSGYNLSQRSWGKPESFEDLKQYIPALKWLLDDLKATVILVPHVYRVNPYVNEYEFINGPDHDILLNLFKMVDGESYNGRLKLIEGKYHTSEAKAVIGQCEMFIAGRLHAGAAALSQGVPTVLLAYSHKHQGFARLFGQEKYAYRGQDPKEIKSLVIDAWTNRAEIAKTLKERMTSVRELVHLNFEVVKEIATLSKSGNGGKIRIPEEMLSVWIKKSEHLQA